MNSQTGQHFESPPSTISIEELKIKFKSKSKYFPIWQEIKQHGFVTVSPTGGHSCQTIANAVERLKMQDHYFRVACELQYGNILHLDYRFHNFQAEESETEKHSVTIKLIDKQNKLNPINLL